MNTMISREQALPGRSEALPVPEHHYVNGNPLQPPFPAGHERILFGMGCFWGAERLFWQLPGVYTTAAGYAGGFTPNPHYKEVCSGQTGHAEVVLVVYDPAILPLEDLLATFWEAHDPTQGMRQGNDRGSQYRSVIYTENERQQALAERSAAVFQQQLDASGLGRITTELGSGMKFYYAEDYHQQYLAKNPGGYCGLQGLGLKCAL